MSSPSKVGGLDVQKLITASPTSSHAGGLDILQSQDALLTIRTPRSRMNWPISPLQVALRLQNRKLVQAIAPDKGDIFHDHAAFADAINGDTAILKEVLKAGLNQQVRQEEDLYTGSKFQSPSKSRPQSARSQPDIDFKNLALIDKEDKDFRPHTVTHGIRPSASQGKIGLGTNRKCYQKRSSTSQGMRQRRATFSWGHEANKIARPHSTQTYLHHSKSDVLKKVDRQRQKDRLILKRKLRAKQKRSERLINRLQKDRKHRQDLKREKEEIRRRSMKSSHSSPAIVLQTKYTVPLRRKAERQSN